MKRWMALLVVGVLAVGAVGAVAAFSLGDDEPADGALPADGGEGQIPACAEISSDCDDTVAPDDQVHTGRDDADGPAVAGMCAEGHPDCADTVVVDAPKDGGAGIAPGEPHPDKPRPVDPKPVEKPVSGGEIREAPIDGIEILMRESYPVQYALQITSGLPNGCTEFDDLEWARSGNVIKVAVLNRVNDGGGTLACTEIYGLVESVVDLGTDFVSGETYTIFVNGVEETFVAQ